MRTRPGSSNVDRRRRHLLWLGLLVCVLGATLPLHSAAGAAGLVGASTATLFGLGGLGLLTALVGLFLWLGAGSAIVGGVVRARPQLALGLPIYAAVLGGLPVLIYRLGLLVLGGEGLWTPGAWRLSAVIAYAGLLLVLCRQLVDALGHHDNEAPTDARDGLLFVFLVGGPWVALVQLLLPELKWEAVRSEPVAGYGFLTLLAVLMGVSGTVLARAFRRGCRKAVRMAVLVAVLCVPGYALLRVGLAPAGAARGSDAIYGLLLGAEGGAALGTGGTVLGWCLLQFAVVVALALGQAAILWLAERRPRKDESVSDSGPSVGRSTVWGWVLVVWAGLFVYGSLVPLEAKDLSFEAALEHVVRLPYLELDVGHRADLVANLVLFVPGAFAAMAWLTRGGRRRGGWLVAPLVLAGGIALAAGVEFAQAWFPPRTQSLNDVLAESAGALLGVTLWLAVGPRTTAWLHQLRDSVTDPVRFARYLLSAYVVALVLYQLFPFDFVISTAEFARQFEEGKVVWLPLTDWLRTERLELLVKSVAFIPVGYWVLVRWPNVRRRVTAAVGVALVIALAIEVLQLFVHSRATSTTDVLFAVVGAGVGAALATRFGPAARRPLPTGVGWRVAGTVVRLALVAGLAGLIVWAKWGPLDVRWPEGGLVTALAARVNVPFYNQYYNSEFRAVGQLLSDVVPQAILGLLLTGLLPTGRAWRVTASVMVGTFAIVMEMGQVAIPGHTADPTTAVLAAGGAIAGVWLYNPLVRTFVRPGRTAATRELEEPT